MLPGACVGILLVSVSVCGDGVCVCVCVCVCCVGGGLTVGNYNAGAAG